MANAEGGPPPGWYADPAGEHRFRWWDGVQWTEHVNDGDDPGAEELTARAEEPQPAPAPSEPVVASSDEPAAVVYTPGPDIGGPAEAGYDAERLLLSETVSGMAEEYPDVDATAVLTRGLVDRTLVRLGEEAELVVVGTHEQGPVSGLVHGRTASIVAEQSSSIVVVVPEPPVDRRDT